MPVDPNKLPDDDKSTREVGYSEEGDHDYEESDSGSETFEPLCLRPEQLTYLYANMTSAERSELNAQVLATHMCFLPKSAISDPSEGHASILDTNKVIMNMHSRVRARVSAAGTEVPPTVTPTEQGEEQEEREGEKDEGEEEDAAPTERSTSDTGTVPPQSETPTQP